MPRTNYQRGADKERRIVNFFRERGCIALRSAGSHSPVDIVVIDKKTHHITLIQSKLNKISTKDREEIQALAQEINGLYEVTFELWEKK